MILWPESAVHLSRLDTASVAGQLAHCHQLESHFLQLWNVCNDRLLPVLSGMEGSYETGRE